MRVVAIVGLAAAFLVASCGGDEEKTDAATLPAGVIASVAGDDITKAQLEREFAFKGRRFTREVGKAGQAARQRIFDMLLIRAAVRHEAAQRGISIPQPLIDKSIRQFRRSSHYGPERTRHLRNEDIARTVTNNLLITRLAESDPPPKWLTAQSESMLLRRWRDRTVCQAGYRSVGCGD